MSNSSKIIKQHIPALTGIRTIAALLVFFFHWFFTHAAHLPLAVRGPFEVGYVGVPIFFALSGFLITLRYAARFAHNEIGYGAYLYNRFIRIYPLYLFVLLFFLFAFGRPTNMMPENGRETVILLTLSQALFPSVRLLGTTVAWTLTIELIFYLIAPFLLRHLRRDHSYPALAGRFLFFSAIGLAAGWAVSRLPTFGLDTILGEPLYPLIHNSIFGNLPDFLIGMIAALVYLKGDWQSFGRWVSRVLIGFSVAAIYGLMLILASIDDPLGAPLNRFLAFSISMGTALLIFGLSIDSERRSIINYLLSTRLMVYLGVTSYALYLVQLTEPIQWLYWVFLGVWLGIEDQVWRAVALYGLTIGVSALLYHLVEHPAHRWLKNRSRIG